MCYMSVAICRYLLLLANEQTSKSPESSPSSVDLNASHIGLMFEVQLAEPVNGANIAFVWYTRDKIVLSCIDIKPYLKFEDNSAKWLRRIDI